MPRSSPMPQVAALEAQIARLEAQLRDSQESLANLQSLEPSRRRSGSTSFESGQRFRALAMHSPIGIYQCDTAGRCLFVNERYCSIAGLPLSECAESGWLRTLHPDDRENVLAAGREAHASGSGFTTEHRFLHADGTVRWVLGSAVALKGFRGEVTGYIGSVLDITHRKQAVAALVASEQRFRLLSNCSPVGIFLADEAGNLIYANPRLHAICGCNSQEQLLGLGFANMIHPNECDAAIANWLRLAPTSDLHNLERKMLNPDGKTRWVHVHSAPLISEAGDVLGRVGTIEDITDSRESHERLRVSEERYRLLAEYSTDMTSEHTFEGIYRYASPACRALLGYEPEELVGKRARDLFHPDDLSALREMSQATAEPFGVTTVEYRIRHKDGRYIWFETVSKSIPDPAVEGAHSIHAVSRDITIRRQAAERLRDSEARMRAILDTAVDGIITVDDSGVVEMFNPGAERLLGYRSEEVVGQSVRMLMSKHDDSGEQQARTLAGFRRASRSPFQVLGRRKDGALVELEMRVGETVVAGRSIFTGILHDITERNRKQKMLHESEKFAATGRIAARIAHEINNPLASIKNSFLLVKDAIEPAHPYFNYVARIESEIDRIARIVRQMFKQYRPTQVTLREIHLDDTIRDVVALLNTITTTQGVRLDVDIAGGCDLARLPDDSVRQVLYNIIVNAIEASPAGGAVTVRAALENARVEISVSDQGEGIAAAIRSQIYEPFFTTKHEQGGNGLGLGLSISRSLVEAIQGTLDFENAPAQGTVFHISIPVLSVATKESEAAHA